MKRNEVIQPVTHPELIDDKCYEALAAAIVQSAAEEYMNAYRARYFSGREPSYSRILMLDKVIRENEEFFRSRRFDILVKGQVDGEEMIERLRYLAEHTDKTSFGAFMR